MFGKSDNSHKICIKIQKVRLRNNILQINMHCDKKQLIRTHYDINYGFMLDKNVAL